MTVFAIAVDPKTPSTLYAGTNGSGVFKSTDGAATWNAAAFKGFSFALAIDPVTPTTVYACANAVQVAKSVNGAATLNRVTGGIPNQPSTRSRSTRRRPRPSTSARQPASSRARTGA